MLELGLYIFGLITGSFGYYYFDRYIKPDSIEPFFFRTELRLLQKKLDELADLIKSK